MASMKQDFVAPNLCQIFLHYMRQDTPICIGFYLTFTKKLLKIFI